MQEHIVLEPMSEDFILWRCLHGGPLSRDSIDQWPSAAHMPWDGYSRRNIPLLIKLTNTYGACAILARDGDRVVGHLRFYPKAISEIVGAGGLCLQQDPPNGPDKDFAGGDFPVPDELADRTLKVHCLMTGSPLQKENPYQRKGIGSQMVRKLIEWARANGWEGIEAEAFEDLPIIYECTGSAGHTFWEKMGFRLMDRHPHPELQDHSQFSEFVDTLEKQAEAAGIPPAKAIDRLIMRLELT
jgi:GNAT superfamily N-acetyltransferase